MQLTNTYILYPDNGLEVARLINLDRMTMTEMGGIFAGVPEVELPDLHNVLDLQCGPGSWVLDVSFAYPDCEVAGIDIRQSMVEYAWARARSQRRYNASFGVMDITRPLDFSDNTFDLVNARFLVGTLHGQSWVPLIEECARILCTGGLLYFVDTESPIETTSPAFNRLSMLAMQAMKMSGYCISPQSNTFSTASILPQLFRQAGFSHTRYTTHVIDLTVGTTAWTDFFHNAEIVFLHVQPFLIGSGLVTQEEFDRLYLQMLIELRLKDFRGRWPLLSIYGAK